MCRALYLPLLLLLLALSGCSSFEGTNKKKGEEERTDPSPLLEFEPEAFLTPLWQVELGSGLKKKYASLSPAADGKRIFAASLSGNVVAVEAESGLEIWRVNLAEQNGTARGKKRPGKGGDLISGGLGAAEGMVFLGTSDGELLALNQSDGSLAWRADSGSEVLAPPEANSSIVVAQAMNGRVTAFDHITGTRKWVYDSQLPPLSLRGTSSPLVNEDVAICGFANGRVLLLDAEEGIPRWERRVSIPSGQSELERLADVDGRMLLIRNRLFVIGYQGQMLSIDVLSGRVIWAREASSYVGLDEGFGNIYAVMDDDHLLAVDQSSSREVWSTEALRYRKLTTPTTIGNHVAVGDHKGYVHLIAQSDGRFTGRTQVDKDGIVGRMIAVEDRLYVQGRSGRLYAYQVR